MSLPLGGMSEITGRGKFKVVTTTDVHPASVAASRWVGGRSRGPRRLRSDILRRRRAEVERSG